MKRLESRQLSVAQAADALALHPSRVRAMIAHGQLDAEKLGGRWLVDRRSVERRKSRPAESGRPFGEANAWALLCLHAGQNPDWVSKWERSRLRRRLREDGIDRLAPRLRKRAARKDFRAHPGLLDKLGDDPRLHPSGISAAAEHGIDIAGADEFEAYVAEGDFAGVVNDHYLEPSANPNVFLHVVSARWIRCCEDEFVASAVAALDLVEADDGRSRRAGGEFLRYLSARRQANDRHS